MLPCTTHTGCSLWSKKNLKQSHAIQRERWTSLNIPGHQLMPILFLSNGNFRISLQPNNCEKKNKTNGFVSRIAWPIRTTFIIVLKVSLRPMRKTKKSFFTCAAQSASVFVVYHGPGTRSIMPLVIAVVSFDRGRLAWIVLAQRLNATRLLAVTSLITGSAPDTTLYSNSRYTAFCSSGVLMTVTSAKNKRRCIRYVKASKGEFRVQLARPTQQQQAEEKKHLKDKLYSVFRIAAKKLDINVSEKGLDGMLLTLWACFSTNQQRRRRMARTSLFIG